MKKLKLLLLVLALSLPAVGQYSVWSEPILNQQGQPVKGAAVAVCNLPQPTTTVPCGGTTPATIYSSFSGGAQTNPIFTDVNGLAPIYTVAGNYFIQIYGNNIQTLVIPISVGGGSSGGGVIGTPGQIIVTAGVVSLANPTIFPGAATSPPPAWPYLAIAQDPQAACAYPLSYFNSSQMQICTFGGNGYLNFGLGNQQIVATINGTPNFPGAVPTYQNSITGIQSGYLPGAPMYIPNQLPGGAVIGGSSGAGTNFGFAFSATDMIRVSGFCNSGLSGTISTLVCNNYADESIAIRAIITTYGSNGVRIIDDMCGTQTWSQIPWTNATNGVIEFGGNCGPTSGNQHVIQLDGVSSITFPTGFSLRGNGGNSFAQVPSGTYFRACNPLIHTCVNGGFQMQSGTITGITGAAGSVMTVTMSGAPFTTCSTGGGAVCSLATAPTNYLQQYRGLFIAGSSTAADNAFWTYNSTTTGTGTQVFKLNAVAAATYTCAASCGTATLDTPMFVIGPGSGNGAFHTRLGNFVLDCDYLPGCVGFVNAAGQEGTGLDGSVQVFNSSTYGFRWDQSPAFGGSVTGDTNSGPNGSTSNNFNPVTCSNTTCPCAGTTGGDNGGHGSCSSVVNGTPGTINKGDWITCGGSQGITTGSIATLSPDPCVNGNWRAFLFTGTGGNQGISGPVRSTCSISDKGIVGAGGIPGLKGSGHTQAACYGIMGEHVSLGDTHTEFINYGADIGGNNVFGDTWQEAYAVAAGSTAGPGVITSGVSFQGGFWAFFTVGFYIGPNDGSQDKVVEICVNNMNMGTGAATALIDTAFGANNTLNNASDVFLTYCHGHGATPQITTTSTTIPNLWANNIVDYGLSTRYGGVYVDNQGSTTGLLNESAAPTTDNNVARNWTSTPVGGVSTAPVWAEAGVVPRANACPANADAIVATDRAKYVTWTDGAACAVSLPSAASFGSNFVFIGCNIGAGTVTITPATSNISFSTGAAYSAAQANMALTTGQCAWIYSDNTNYFAVRR